MDIHDDVSVAAVPGRGRDGRRRPVRFDPGHVRALCATAPQQFTQHARNPARSVEIGGEQRRVRAGVRLTVRARPRRRAAVRLARRLRELREARLRDAVAAPLRRHGLRAGRRRRSTSATSTWCTPTSATPTRRSWARSPSPVAPRTPSRWPASCSARLRRIELRHPRQRQRQLAARLGRGDDRLDPRLRAGEPGAGRRAVHPRRRDGTGHARRRDRPGARRDDGRRRARPARAAGLAGDLRQLPVVDGAAIGRADVRHARAGARLARRRPDGTPRRPAAAVLGIVHDVEGARRAGDARVGGVDAGGDPVRRQLHPALGRLARGRAGDGVREVHRRRRLLRRVAHLPAGHRSDRRPVRARRLRRGRSRQALLRRPAHAAPLRDRVLGQLDRRQLELRAVARRRRAARRGARRRPGSPRCSPPTNRHRSTSAVDEALQDFVARRKAEMPDQWY